MSETEHTDHGVVSRDRVVTCLNGQPEYGEKFKSIVLDIWDADHQHALGGHPGSRWKHVVLIPRLDSEEDGRVIPYNICIIVTRSESVAGFCANDKEQRARFMDTAECMELLRNLGQEAEDKPESVTIKKG